ncbi:MAG: hypothetical protein ACRDQH_07975 [Pseudonocardiaceae bacterium]
MRFSRGRLQGVKVDWIHRLAGAHRANAALNRTVPPSFMTRDLAAVERATAHLTEIAEASIADAEHRTPSCSVDVPVRPYLAVACCRYRRVSYEEYSQQAMHYLGIAPGEPVEDQLASAARAQAWAVLALAEVIHVGLDSVACAIIDATPPKR